MAEMMGVFFFFFFFFFLCHLWSISAGCVAATIVRRASWYDSGPIGERSAGRGDIGGGNSRHVEHGPAD